MRREPIVLSPGRCQRFGGVALVQRRTQSFDTLDDLFHRFKVLRMMVLIRSDLLHDRVEMTLKTLTTRLIKVALRNTSGDQYLSFRGPARSAHPVRFCVIGVTSCCCELRTAGVGIRQSRLDQ